MANDPKTKKQEIASALINGLAQQYSLASSAFRDPGERTTLSMSVASVGLAAAAMALVKSDDNGSGYYVPTNDDILFACLFTGKSISFRPDGSLEVEFCITNVISTIAQFQEITGRSIEDKLNPTLLGLVNDERKKALTAFAGDLSKFRPQ